MLDDHVKVIASFIWILDILFKGFKASLLILFITVFALFVTIIVTLVYIIK